eukprot:UC4_evm1s640
MTTEELSEAVDDMVKRIDPSKYVDCKPPFSFPCLIGMALRRAKGKQMAVGEIYEFIISKFPYYATAKAGWKNSVRHNLSLNKFFVKLEKEDKKIKSSQWTIVSKMSKQLDQDILLCSMKMKENEGKIDRARILGSGNTSRRA